MDRVLRAEGGAAGGAAGGEVESTAHFGERSGGARVQSRAYRAVGDRGEEPAGAGPRERPEAAEGGARDGAASRNGGAILPIDQRTAGRAGRGARGERTGR